MKNIIKNIVFIVCMLASMQVFAYEHDISISFTDTSNNQITQIGDLDGVKISCVVNSPVTVKTSYKLYAAVYNADGSLVGVQFKNGSLFKTSSVQKINMTVNEIELKPEYTLKAFLWNENNSPMCNSAEISKYTVTDVHLSGIYSILNTVECKYLSGNSDVTFEWYTSDSETGEYTVIDGADDNLYVIPYCEKEQWIKARVISGTRKYDSEPRYIEPSWRAKRLSLLTSESLSSVNNTTPPENVFTIDGVDFILLDITESDSAKYLVMSKHTLGEAVAFSANKDVTSSNSSYLNMDSYLNNTFKNKGYIPEKMLPYIDNNIVWKFENNWWYNNATGVSEYGGIAIPSQQDIIKYADKIGLQDTGNIWWTRSCYANSNDGNSIIAMPSDESLLGTSISLHSSKTAYLRPMFYLDKAFFENVPVNLRTCGENVKKIISGMSKEEMIALGYEIDDISAFYDYVSIDGRYEPFETVRAKCDGDTTYQWMISDRENGTYVDVADATEAEYTITKNDAEKWLKVRTANGYYSKAVQIGKYRSDDKLSLVSTFDTVMKDTPEKNVFEVSGTEYVLLDAFNNSEGRYLIMSRKCMGENTYRALAEPIESSPDFKNMGTYLNTEFKELGYISDDILSHVCDSIVWQYENNYWNQISDGKFVGGIAIPSLPEIQKYCDKIGLSDDGSDWWLRTAYGTYAADGNAIQVVSGSNIGTTKSSHSYNNTNGIRPIFYVDDEFFSSVKLNYAGENVKAQILRDYSLSELMGTYSYDEINDLFFKEQERAEIIIEHSEGENTAVIDISIGGRKEAVYVVKAYWGDKLIFETEQKKDKYEINLPYGTEALTVNVTREDNVIGTKMVGGISSEIRAERAPLAEFTLKGFNGPFSSGMFTRAESAGTTLARTNIYWKNVEKQKGVYDFDEWDNYINNCFECGIIPIATLCYGNSLYTENGDAPTSKEAFDGFINYAMALAERYPDLKYFEIWNEPNSNSFWSPRASFYDYTGLIKVTERALKNVNPDIVVISGAVADARQEVIDKMYNYGVYEYTDVIASHPYVYYYNQGIDTSYKERINRVKNISLTNGGWISDWITEVGFPTHKGSISEEQSIQAAELVKQYVVADGCGIDANITYQIRDVGTDNTDAEHRFGVIDMNNTPKKAYYAIDALMSYIQGALYMGELSDSDNLEAYLYSRDGEPVLVAWAKSGTETLDYTNAIVHDMYGNVIDGLTIGTEPMYITGLDKSYLKTAAINEAIKRRDEMLASIGVQNIGMSFENAEGTKAFLDSHFALADNIIAMSSDDKTRSAMLYILSETAEPIVNLYAVTGAAKFDCIEDISALENKIAERTKTVGQTLPYTQAMFGEAKRYADYAERAGETSYGYAWNAYAAYIADMAISFAETEKVGEGDIIIHVPLGEASLEYNIASDLKVSVYNYDDKAIENGVLEIITSDGKAAGTAVVNIPANSTAKISVNTLIPDGGADDSFAIARISVDGNIVKTENVIVMKQLEIYEDISANLGIFKEKTSSADIFTVSGKDFILLDKTPDGKYFCMTKDVYTVSTKYHTDCYQVFDVHDEGSIANWLNTNYFFKLRYIPLSMHGYIKENWFTTEGGSQIGRSPFDTQTKTTFAPISMYELMKYRDIIGIRDDNNTSYWMLRSFRNVVDLSHQIRVVNITETDGVYYFSTGIALANGVNKIRPVFYLEADFFDKVLVDSMGENVELMVGN